MTRTRRPSALEVLRSGSGRSGIGGRTQAEERRIDRALVNAIVDGTCPPMGVTLKDMDAVAEEEKWERYRRTT